MNVLIGSARNLFAIEGIMPGSTGLAPIAEIVLLTTKPVYGYIDDEGNIGKQEKGSSLRFFSSADSLRLVGQRMLAVADELEDMDGLEVDAFPTKPEPKPEKRDLVVRKGYVVTWKAFGNVAAGSGVVHEDAYAGGPAVLVEDLPGLGIAVPLEMIVDVKKPPAETAQPAPEVRYGKGQGVTWDSCGFQFEGTFEADVFQGEGACTVRSRDGVTLSTITMKQIIGATASE